MFEELDILSICEHAVAEVMQWNRGHLLALTVAESHCLWSSY